jgi:multiple sugar transport system permease protein
VTAAAPARKRRRSRAARRRSAWLLTAPAVLVMVAVAGAPLLYAGWLSLQRYDLRFPGQRGFVGLGNYGAVLAAPVFWSDLAATVVITAIAVPVEVGLGLAIALLLRRGLAGARAVHTALLLPYGIITVVAAFAWRYLATPDLSFLTERAWLGERWSSYALVIATEVWKSTPFVALLLLAGLTAVTAEVIDTARMDGASGWQRFTRVLLPGIRPVLLVAVLYRTLDSIRLFDTVLIQTDGANGTETLSLLAYRQLTGRLNLGLGSAVSVLLFLLAAAFAVGFIGVFRADLRELYRGGRP